VLVRAAHAITAALVGTMAGLPSTTETRMIHVQIFYPPSSRFDMAYYCEKHMPMVQARIGAACTGFTVDAGLAGVAPGTPPSYAAIGTLHVTSVEALQAALAKHGGEIMGDVPNYTDAQPVLQISEVKVG
jgi:uncharacterized protein (TIGR02118 family)